MHWEFANFATGCSSKWSELCSAPLRGRLMPSTFAGEERPPAIQRPSSSSAVELPVTNEAHSSGVSWSAIIAGAFAAAALSLALLALGTGIGFSESAAWVGGRMSSTRIGWTAVVWLVFMQIIASSVGGYLAGRLRTRWVHVHTHEVYFRDTAHGFLVWAVSLVMTAGILTSASTALSDGGMRTGTSGPDAAFLTPPSSSTPSFSSASPSEIYAAAQQSAETTRKAIAHSMYWTFVALLVGAFCASVAATIGGRERDHVVVV